MLGFFAISVSGFVYSLKPNGPIHDSCGNPYLWCTSSDSVLFMWMHCFRSSRYNCIQEATLPFMPYSMQSCDKNTWWSVVSNAALTSRRTKMHCGCQVDTARHLWLRLELFQCCNTSYMLTGEVHVVCWPKCAHAHGCPSVQSKLFQSIFKCMTG